MTTSMLANDIQTKQPEREKIAADVAKWEAKHGKPVCYGQGATSERLSELEAVMAAARSKGGKRGSESTNRRRVKP